MLGAIILYQIIHHSCHRCSYINDWFTIIDVNKSSSSEILFMNMHLLEHSNILHEDKEADRKN